MQPATGRPLLDALEESTDPVGLVAELVSHVATAHAHGTAFGGVLPDQAVLQANGRVGLARWEPRHGLMEVADEAWPFLSPEAAQGMADGPPSDVYSLGRWIAEAAREPSSPIQRVIDRCTARVPSERYEDACALAAALAEARAHSERDTEDTAHILEVIKRHAGELKELRDKAKWAHQSSDTALYTRLQQEADRVWATLGGLAEAVLALSPDHARAHRLLADLAYRDARTAEDRQDPVAVEQALARLRLHDRGWHTEYLRGEGLVSLYSEPAGAAVTLYQHVLQGTTLVPTRKGLPLRTPIERSRIAAGSWEARLERPGFSPVIYPFAVARQTEWEPTAPGEFSPTPITLVPLGILQPNERYVPAGWARLGGDGAAPGAGPARLAWLEDFVIQAYPVTHAEYLAFLNDLIRQRRFDEVDRAQPKVVGAHGELKPLYVTGFANALDLPTRAEGVLIDGEQPVVGVDRHGAEAYALWYSVKTGHRWRLPTEAQWEKAARGVDGRAFPWGPHFDTTRAATAEKKLTRVPAAHDLERDASPYRVHGMAGGVHEWTSSAWEPTGVAVDAEGYTAPGTGRDSGAEVLVLRGGSYLDGRDWARCAARGRVGGSARQPDLGFRLVRPPMTSGTSSVPHLARGSAPDRH